MFDFMGNKSSFIVMIYNDVIKVLAIVMWNSFGIIELHVILHSIDGLFTNGPQMKLIDL